MIDRDVKRNKKLHSIFKKDKSALNPISELNVIIIKEVATACLIVNLANKTNACHALRDTYLHN